MKKTGGDGKTAAALGGAAEAENQSLASGPDPTPAEVAALIAAILHKAQSGSVDHAKLLADCADYAPRGLYAAVKPNDLQAVISAMMEKADANHKAAARLIPKLRKALAYVQSQAPAVTRG